MGVFLGRESTRITKKAFSTVKPSTLTYIFMPEALFRTFRPHHHDADQVLRDIRGRQRKRSLTLTLTLTLTRDIWVRQRKRSLYNISLSALTRDPYPVLLSGEQPPWGQIFSCAGGHDGVEQIHVGDNEDPMAMPYYIYIINPSRTPCVYLSV